ncbi:MAG: RimK family alpha-L-glutamate ligase [Bacteroidota bacterium]
MNVGILSRGKELYSTQSLFAAGKRRGLRMSVIDHTRCSLSLAGRRPNVFYDGKPLHHLKAVIPRIGASVTDLGAAVISQFELMGIPSVTSPWSLQTARDKLRCLQLLQQHSLPIPKTMMIGPGENLHQAAFQLGGFPIVVKLLSSTHGEGVELARNFWDLQGIVRYHLKFQDRLLLQEFIQEAKGKDIRALVVDDQVVAAMERKAAAGEFRSNLHRGASAKTVQLSPADTDLVLRVTKALKIDIAGVDLLPSKQGPLIMEVNASPGLEGIEKTTGVDIAGKIIALTERKIAAQRERV